MKIALPLILLATLSSTAGIAEGLPSDDPAPGYAAILSADYAAAEREIRSANVPEDDAARSINLGIVFAKTGRPDAAAQLFRRVLNLDDVQIVVADRRTMSSHEVAARALSRLDSGDFDR